MLTKITRRGAPGSPVRSSSVDQKTAREVRRVCAWSAAPCRPETRERAQEAAMDGGDSDAERHDVFIGTVLTLQRIDCAQQTFMVTGYVNAMWHCSDLEKEVSRQDYYGPENSLTVKDGLQLARKQKAGEQLKGEDEKRAVPGYIRSSVADDKEERHFVTGFTLSHESDVLPFNPSKMFEDRRIVPETFEREEETYYYYPEDENEGKVRTVTLHRACPRVCASCRPHARRPPHALKGHCDGARTAEVRGDDQNGDQVSRDTHAAA